jgi:hypothetical protein
MPVQLEEEADREQTPLLRRKVLYATKATIKKRHLVIKKGIW